MKGVFVWNGGVKGRRRGREKKKKKKKRNLFDTGEMNRVGFFNRETEHGSPTRHFSQKK